MGPSEHPLHPPGGLRHGAEAHAAEEDEEEHVEHEGEGGTVEEELRGRHTGGTDRTKGINEGFRCSHNCLWLETQRDSNVLSHILRSPCEQQADELIAFYTHEGVEEGDTEGEGGHQVRADGAKHVREGGLQVHQNLRGMQAA